MEDIFQINLLEDAIPVDEGDGNNENNEEVPSSKDEGGGTVIKPPFGT